MEELGSSLKFTWKIRSNFVPWTLREEGFRKLEKKIPEALGGFGSEEICGV